MEIWSDSVLPPAPVSEKQLEQIVRDAWTRVQDESPSLEAYSGGEFKHAIERALMFRLGVQLNHVIRDTAASWSNQWRNVTVDSELHLADGGDLKLVNRKGFPDLIVHVRGTDGFNLLVLEGKHGKGPNSTDKRKLKLLTGHPRYYRNAWALNLPWRGELEIEKF